MSQPGARFIVVLSVSINNMGRPQSCTDLKNASERNALNKSLHKGFRMNVSDDVPRTSYVVGKRYQVTAESIPSHKKTTYFNNYVRRSDENQLEVSKADDHRYSIQE